MGQNVSLPQLKLFKRRKSYNDVNFCNDCEHKLQQNTSNNYSHINAKELYEERRPCNAYPTNPVSPQAIDITNRPSNSNPRIRHTRSELLMNHRFQQQKNKNETGLSASLPNSTSFHTLRANCHHCHHCHQCKTYFYNQEIYLQGNINAVVDNNRNNNTMVSFHPLPPPPRPNSNITTTPTSYSFNDHARTSFSTHSITSLPSSSTSSLPIHYQHHPTMGSGISHHGIKMDKPHEDETSNKTLYHE
ncbi:unnamed protein product [Cunninghamella blakesleeana]